MRGPRQAGLACACAALLGGACSGGSGPTPNTIATPADNVTELSVDFGLPNIGYLNGLFATVRVCVPSSSDCQIIDHVLVDTGSSGLRLLGSALTLSLPTWTNDSGVPLAECSQFVGAFLWGPLHSADLRIASEQANGIAIQVIDESSYPVPSSCTGSDASSAEGLKANGILGVSSVLQDCGPFCAAPLGIRSSNPGMYYACSSTKVDGCQIVAVPVSKQLVNPVSLFGQDNNGTIIELPAVPANGAPSVAGSLVFGIGTRENNGLDRATVIRLDDQGLFSASYPANAYPTLSFADTGSPAIYFLDSRTTQIPTCSDPLSDFYCPFSTLSLSAKLQDAFGLVATTVNFSIANAKALSLVPNNVAFGNLGGPSTAPLSGTTTGPDTYFDWGLPFHFGRNVFTAIEGQSTPAGMGPYLAF